VSKRMMTLWTGAVAICVLSSGDVADERVVVRPQDNGQALRNPDMGWDFPYFTDNGDNHYGGRTALDDTLDWFPGCNCIYFRTGWGRIEPKEGQFNWDYTDKVAEKWIAGTVSYRKTLG